MIKYTIDSTLTLRETHVFKNGLRGSAEYDRKNNSENGFTLSSASKRKIKRCISGYFLENNDLGKNISWVTLTVPPRIDGFKYQEWCDDPLIIKQLSKFLENLRKNHGLKNYIWVAERQDGKRNNYKTCTGAIHFHCIFDFQGFVDYRNLNLYWLRLMNEIGYKAFSKKQFDKIKDKLFSIEETYQRYKETIFKRIAKDSINLPEYQEIISNIALKELVECQEIIEHQDFRTALSNIDPMTLNPEHPFTKISFQPYEATKIQILNFDMLQTYLTKYVTKNETRIHGRVWGASRGFTSVNYEIQISDKQAAELKEIENIVVCQSEKTFDIGTNQFTSLSTKLRFDLFKKTDVYKILMDSIFTQRLNPEQYEIPVSIPVEKHYEFVTDMFSRISRKGFSVNDEVRMIPLDIPAFNMPICLDFYERTNEDRIRNPKVTQCTFEFDIELDKKLLKN